MRLLALDLATKTGWAHSYGASGVQDFSPRRGDSPGMRWLEFKAWLCRLLDSSPADVIAYEQAHHRGGAATHVAHSLISCVEQVAAERGIEVTSRHTATIKKHALGRGRGDKLEMIEAAVQRGWFPKDDNECDALWLLDLVKRELSEAK
jgi:crossover junction endodeoxyribonuclease RuvC